MDEQNTFACLGRYTPVPWEQIPDLGLYMDQVITFITHAYEPLYGESTPRYLSAPMINNYVKNKLIPRPVGKKYNRVQIALLIMIVALKQVCMMEDIRAMLSWNTEDEVRTLYELFCQRQNLSIREMLSQKSELPHALDCAVFAAAYRAGCECLLTEERKRKKQPKKPSPKDELSATRR